VILHLLHDCTLDGQTVRHHVAVDYREIALHGGAYRLAGTRCDGTAIEAIGQRIPGGIIASNSCATPGDPDRYHRQWLEFATGTEYVSRDHGPWEPLIEFPEQPEVCADQPSLLDEIGATS
jgi:hypothetical protein